MSIAFTNAKLVCPKGGVSNGGLIVQGDTIAAIGTIDIPEDAETIDLGGRMLAPALIDLGVFAVDKQACRFGGIARVGLMPDQSPVLDDPGIVRRAALSGKPELWVHPMAAATQGLGGTDLGEIAINASAGARAVATGRRWVASAGPRRTLLGYARVFGLWVFPHPGAGGRRGGGGAPPWTRGLRGAATGGKGGGGTPPRPATWTSPCCGERLTWALQSAPAPAAGWTRHGGR